LAAAQRVSSSQRWSSAPRDLNMITAGKLVELIAGKPLDRVVRERITAPLSMRDTGYNPPTSELARIAATEYQSSPARGMVRGSVHDENAWAR